MKKVILACIIVAIGIAVIVLYQSGEEETVAVGVIAPFSGVRADAGEFTRNALRIAEDEVNTDPKREYKLKLIFEDSQYRPQVAVSAAQKLIDIDGVDYIVGPYGSSQVLAVVPLAENSQTILITPGSQSDEVTHAGDYIFRNIHNAAQEAPLFADFVAQKMQGDTLHFLAINTAFSDSYLNNFLPTLEAHGKSIGLIERFDADEADFRTQLLKLKAQNPTDIFPIATPKHMGLILVQAHELGIDANFYHIGVEGPDLVATAGDLAEGVVYPYSYDSHSSHPAVRTFYEKYGERFGTEPDTIAANAYDAAYLLSNCFEKVGNNVEAVKACLYDTERFEGASGTYGFDENGDAVKEIFIKTVKNGQFVRHEE